MKTITLIIATWNRSAGLARTLASLGAQILPPGEWEAVVVNNNSTDDTTEVFERFAASAEGRALNVRMVDCVGYLAYEFLDGKLVRSEAVKVMRISA